MLYRVLVDGDDILDYNDPELVLLSPQLEVELDVSGSFEFTVPPNHKYYDRFTAESIMAMTIEVWEDSIMHWFGRPIEYHLDFYKNKKINCEGALAYFNDSVIRSEEWDESSLSTIFQAVLSEHNSMVPENRRFVLGNFTVNDLPVYRKFNYEQTFDVLKSKFLDAEEGHLFVRRENGINYIDFLRDMPYICNQDVEFAENLLNFTYSFDGKDFATCVIPLGANDSETGLPIDIKSVNDGSDILIGPSAVNYGNIVKVQQYGDIDDPSKLMEEGRKYLTTLQYNAFLIECSAVDLHATDGSQQQFRVGQMVNCISNPHSIELELPISKMVLYLDSAVKQITLGRIPKKTLSRFYKEKVAEGGGGGGYTIDEDEIPSGWEIIPPDTDGGSPTMRRVPSNIVIHEAPLQINYNQDETIDFTGLKIRILTPKLDGSGLETYTDSRYPTGIISYPSSELILPVTKVTQKSAQIKVPVQWRCPYTGHLMVNYFNIVNLTQKALDEEHGDLPEYIAVTADGKMSRTVYKDGQYIDYSSLVVRAYYHDGTLYDKEGYKNGIIPVSELEILPKQASIEACTGSEYSDGEGLNVVRIDCDIAFPPYPTSTSTTYYRSDYIAGADSNNRPTAMEKIYSQGSDYWTVYEYSLYGMHISGDNGWNMAAYDQEQGYWTHSLGSAANTGNGSSFIEVWDVSPSNPLNYNFYKDLPKSTVNPLGKTAESLRLMGGTQVISINWKRSDGLTLTTTHRIKVEATDE